MRQACGRIFDRVMRGLLLISGIHLASGPVLGQTPEWSLRRGVAIGSVDDPVYGLSEVRGVLADADHVYVLLGQEGKVRVFTRAGEFVRDLGGRGEGPGELMMPSSMGWRGSRLWVADVGLWRFTLLDVATGEAETIPYDVDAPLASHFSSVVPRAILDNGRLVGSPTYSALRVAARGGFGTCRSSFPTPRAPCATRWPCSPSEADPSRSGPDSRPARDLIGRIRCRTTT